MNSPDIMKVKQGAAIGGWLCFFLGAGIMYFSVWTFILYVPLFLVAFILSIAAMAQGRIVLGIVLLLATLIVPPIQWFVLTATRLDKFMKDNPVPGVEPSRQPAPPIPLATPRPIIQSAPPLTGAPRPVQDPKSAERATIDKIFHQPLRDAHAWQIQIAYTRELARNASSQPVPVFSADGDTVTYAQKQGESVTLVIANLSTHEILSRWTPQESPMSLGWSPDRKKLAYVSNTGVHIVDWATKQDISLPLTQSFGDRDCPLLWMEANKLSYCNGYADDFTLTTLDLDTLKVVSKRYSENASNPKLWNSLNGSTSIHSNCNVFQGEGEGGQNNPFLYVGEKDDPYAQSRPTFFYDDMKRIRSMGTYSHVLLNHFHSSTHFHVSPDLRHLLTIKGSSLTHHILGLREAPDRFFRADLSYRDLLDDKQKKLFGRQAEVNVPFWGYVYSPLTNPLTGSTIGPDHKRLKGRVRVIKWHDTHIEIAVAEEHIPIKAGDILSNVFSESWPSFGNWNIDFGDEWRPLRQSTNHVGIAPQQTQQQSNALDTAVVSIAKSQGSDELSKPGSTSAVTPETVQKYVTRLHVMESNQDFEALMAHYPARLRYFDNGLVDKAFVLKDKIDYSERWPIKSFEPHGEIIFKAAGENLLSVEVPLKFRVENRKAEWIDGDVTQMLLINTSTQPWQITSETGKTTRREKGQGSSAIEQAAKPAIRTSHAGLWRGPTVFRGTDGTVVNAIDTIVVSENQKFVETNWTGSGRGPFKSSATRTGDTLTWTITQGGGNSPEWRKKYSLRLTGDKTADLNISVQFIGGKWKGTSARAAGQLARR